MWFLAIVMTIFTAVPGHAPRSERVTSYKIYETEQLCLSASALVEPKELQKRANLLLRNSKPRQMALRVRVDCEMATDGRPADHGLDFRNRMFNP